MAAEAVIEQIRRLTHWNLGDLIMNMVMVAEAVIGRIGRLTHWPLGDMILNMVMAAKAVIEWIGRFKVWIWCVLYFQVLSPLSCNSFNSIQFNLYCINSANWYTDALLWQDNQYNTNSKKHTHTRLNTLWLCTMTTYQLTPSWWMCWTSQPSISQADYIHVRFDKQVM